LQTNVFIVVEFSGPSLGLLALEVAKSEAHLPLSVVTSRRPGSVLTSVE